MSVGERSRAERLYALEDVQQLRFKRFVDHRGLLVPIEAEQDIPIPVRRLFYVKPAFANETRGQHGHYTCSQLLIAVSGAIRVVVQDGEREQEYRLDSPDQGLLVPPTLWAEEIYETEDTVLLVLCDKVFDAGDYIDEFEDLLALRGIG